MIKAAIEDTAVLLVEDDPGHAELVKRNFERTGIALENVYHVDNGQRALDFVFGEGEFAESQASPDKILMLLDLNMPVMGGEQVLEHLKGNDMTEEIPVIVLTTTESQHEIERCYELGCNLYLTKPVDYGAFSETLQELGILLPHIKVPTVKHYAN